MILDGILCYGAHLKGIDVNSELLSLSVAEISAEEEALVAPFLFSTTRVSVHKKGATKASSSVDISGTERLSNSNCW